MRLICTLLAVAVLAPLSASGQGATAAGSWQNYDYPEAHFSVHFPAVPTVISTTYSAGGRVLPATVYTVSRGEVVYTVTTADFSKLEVDGVATIDEAVKAFGRQGDIRLDVEARINRQYGRELSVVGKDGSRSMVGVFFFNHHLYQLDGRALPPDALAAGSSTIRFQQSLQFPYD